MMLLISKLKKKIKKRVKDNQVKMSITLVRYFIDQRSLKIKKIQKNSKFLNVHANQKLSINKLWQRYKTQ